MISLFRSAAIGSAAFLLALSTGGAQTGSISGRVTTRVTNQPIADARVEALSNAKVVASTNTSADGSYTLAGLPAGSYSVLARHIGMEFRLVDSVAVTAGGKASLDIATSPISQLDQVSVTADRGAQAEKILDSPNAITVVPQVQIAERAASSVTDYIKAVPGLSVSTGGIAQANIVSRGFNNAFSGSMLMLQDYRFAGVPRCG